MQFYSVEGGASARGVQAICAFDSLRVRMGARTATMSIYPPNPGQLTLFSHVKTSVNHYFPSYCQRVKPELNG